MSNLLTFRTFLNSISFKSISLNTLTFLHLHLYLHLGIIIIIIGISIFTLDPLFFFFPLPLLLLLLKFLHKNAKPTRHFNPTYSALMPKCHIASSNSYGNLIPSKPNSNINKIIIIKINQLCNIYTVGITER